jgi:hypothetical protein
MIYAEFIDRERSVPVDMFRHLSRQENWGEGEDVRTINIGRHKGIGPRPAYLCCWRISGLSRLDAWETIFKSPAGRRDVSEHATALALDFQSCGLYEELVAGDLPDGNIHYMERFDAGAEARDEDVREHFLGRAGRNGDVRLAFLLRRVGLLGPERCDLAIWTFASFAASEALVRQRHGAARFAPWSAGYYRNVGHELM